MCTDFESRFKKKLRNKQNGLPSSTLGSSGAFTAGRLLMARATETEYGATEKIKTYFCPYVRDHVRIGIFFLSLILEANLYMAFDAEGTAPPVRED